jgi:hypothetical protein
MLVVAKTQTIHRKRGLSIAPVQVTCFSLALNLERDYTGGAHTRHL